MLQTIVDVLYCVYGAKSYKGSYLSAFLRLKPIGTVQTSDENNVYKHYIIPK